MHDDERRGMGFAIACYTIWGAFPLYFRLLAPAPALDILGHRVIWSLAFLVILLTARREWAWLGPALRNPRTLGLYAAAGAILAANWYTYIWGVNAGFVIETSLGYFINPLVSVLIGVLFLRERLRAGQWIAIAVAASGVLFLTLSYGQAPWIALALAFTFGFYGLLKKHGTLRSMQGLTLETGALFLPALALLFYRDLSGHPSLFAFGWQKTLLLLSTGLVTVMPLVWFASAARLIPLSMLGILQYIAPTLQFLVGLLIFHEPFDQTRLIGFAMIWLALLIYSAEGVIHQHALREARL
ncbi:EamA family transporter RarD [Caldilinea sp.]|uniref:EamA family transporter RarD n=1 Tax=Caldilinea sp. TaxID=2293560 RepID=UPI0021DE5FE6|nr:EamA family transporter RarD [Caldilinea sp.]GIV68129.1 MAG: membrane protein [Caldilinea sp.]